MTITIAYWNIRGLGSVSKLLLRYTGVEYEDISYDINGDDYEKWSKSIKNSLGLDFPNLPYLIDDEVKITQSQAIARYIGAKFNLSGSSPAERAYEDMIAFQVNDLLQRIVQSAYHRKYNSSEEFQAELKTLKKDLHSHLALLEKYIQDKDWFTGERLSYVDFFAYEIIDWYRELIEKDCLAKYPSLTEFMNKFEQLEPLKEYLASEQYRKAPIFTPTAKFNNV